MGLMVDRHFRHEIYLNFRAKIKLKFRTKSSKFVRCKKFDFFLDFPTLYYLSSRQYDIKFLVKVWLLGPHLFFLTLLLGQTSRPELLYYFSRASSFHIYSTQGLLLGHFLKREIFTRRKNFRNSKLNQPIFFNEQLLNSLKKATQK